MRFRAWYSSYFLLKFTLNLRSKRSSTCESGMWSEVQHRGGMCAGSLTAIRNRRFKHEWHMRWPQESFAVLEDGSSSEHVRHSTFFAEASDEGLFRKKVSRKDSRLFLWGLGGELCSDVDGSLGSSSTTAGSPWLLGGVLSRTTVRGLGW